MAHRPTGRLILGGLLGAIAAVAIVIGTGAILGYSSGLKLLGDWGGGLPPGTFDAAVGGAYLLTLAFGLAAACVGLVVGVALAFWTRSGRRCAGISTVGNRTSRDAGEELPGRDAT